MEPTISEIRKWFAVSRTRGSGIYRLHTLGDEWPAWVIRFGDGEYGVGIEYTGNPINEDFNEIRFFTSEFYLEDKNRNLLMLTSETETAREQFAIFCYSLVDPGPDGVFRKNIEASPLDWWKEWKTLVGNTSVDKKPHAVVGELLVLKQLLEQGLKVHWSGPEGGIRDLETEDAEYEVKSTLNRYGQSIKINGQFQLEDGTKSAFLVFNRFEKKVSGLSINSLVSEITGEFDYPAESLEKGLKKLGYRPGMSSRDEAYELIEQMTYRIDDSFPQITRHSFVGGIIPVGITKIVYDVDLTACQSNLVDVYSPERN